MSEARFKDDLIRGLIAIAQQRAPVALERFLTRMQFRAGDISFRFTKSGKYWAEIRRWPWEQRLVCVDCGITIDRETFEQFEACSSCRYLRRAAADGAVQP